MGTKKFTQELRLTSPGSSALEWQVGGYYTRETSALNEHLNAAELPSGTQLGLIEQPLIESVYKETAGFGDLTYHFNSQFDIQVGGRYSHNEQTFAQTTTFNSPDIADPPVFYGKLERQCVHLFGRAQLARGCEHHGVCARGDRLSPGRPE